jgi:hypothetical protein
LKNLILLPISQNHYTFQYAQLHNNYALGRYIEVLIHYISSHGDEKGLLYRSGSPHGYERVGAYPRTGLPAA